MNFECLRSIMRSRSEKKNQKFECVRFLHLSDLHFPDVKFQDISIDKENGYKSPHISVLNQVYNILDDVDFILISGDFTTGSCLEGFSKCLSLINEKFSHHNIRIYSVFGNHDLNRKDGEKKFDQFLLKAQEYPYIDFVGREVCEQRKLITHHSIEMEFDLILINSCKNSSDNPIVPEKLKKCVKEPISKLYGEKTAEELWDKIRVKIEESTLIDDISFQERDYTILRNTLANFGSLICLSHYNLVSFNGIDKLSSFFSDQGKFRDIFVNHRNTVIYLSGHTHTQECTVIENPEDYTNKLICITSPPFFKTESSAVNGFNIVDVILRKDDNNIYKPVGCKIQKIDGNVTNRSAVDCKRIRFSRNITNLKFTDDEFRVIKTLRDLSGKTGGNVRIKKLLESLNQSDVTESKRFNVDYLHEILMYLWWIGVIDEYSAMKRENEFEAKLIDYVGGILCLPISH